MWYMLIYLQNRGGWVGMQSCWSETCRWPLVVLYLFMFTNDQHYFSNVAINCIWLSSVTILHSARTLRTYHAGKQKNILGGRYTQICQQTYCITNPVEILFPPFKGPPPPYAFDSVEIDVCNVFPSYQSKESIYSS